MIIDKNWLGYIWGFIGEGNKVESIVLKDMNDISNVKILVDEYLIPFYDNLPELVRIRLKLLWKYSINNFPNTVLEHELSNLLPPFNVPVDIRNFYRSAWILLFPRESHEILDSENIILTDNRFSTPWD